MYRRCLKRIFDLACSLAALVVFSPFLLMLTVLGAALMKGNPFFTQQRPGRKDKDGKERIFRLIKFRTMSNARDENGELLPDDVRLNGYGRFLRSSSLDELPELINILKGDMSVVGPRPQLVRDLVFMSDDVRRRHDVRPGLTGLAQVNGRNDISWEEKFELDLRYLEDITFKGDVKIILQTVGKVLKRSGIVREGTVSDIDYGDWLLQTGRIDSKEYSEKRDKAIAIQKNGR